MSFLIDDEFEETTEERRAPTEEQTEELKVFIRSTVKSFGGKVDLSDVCKLCHEQFPGVFTWGEVEKACSDVQSEYDVKRPATMAVKLEAKIAAAAAEELKAGKVK